MAERSGESPLRHIEARYGRTYLDPPREGADYQLVYRTPLEETWNIVDWLGGDEEEDKPEPAEHIGPKEKRLLGIDSSRPQEQPVSECGSFCQGPGGHPRGDRRRSLLM